MDKLKYLYTFSFNPHSILDHFNVPIIPLKTKKYRQNFLLSIVWKRSNNAKIQGLKIIFKYFKKLQITSLFII